MELREAPEQKIQQVARSRPFVVLAVLLAVQAGLLFFRLGLLPVWTDELFTIQTVAHPIPEIVSLVRRDIHPPLYFFLLHYWQMLPLPWAGVAALRSFSAFTALLATLLLDLFWTRAWRPLDRWLILGMFALSPCLLLYGRMARSYSMQVVLVMVLVALVQRWMRAPASLAAACGSTAAALALLYTHYLPGLAVLVGFIVVGWRSLGPRRIVAFVSAIGVGYLPWLLGIMDAARRWSEASGFSANYALSGSRALEPLIKIGFGLVSFAIGECFVVGSLLLVPLILLLALSGSWSCSRRGVVLLATAGIVGYIGTSRWTSYPFIPARLLWLLPFFSVAVGRGIARLERPILRQSVAILILLSYGSSIVLYFQRDNFLNMAYNAPLPEVAETLNKLAGPTDLIVFDGYNVDWQAIIWLLTGRAPYLELDATTVSDARLRIGSASTVWVVRNTRDISPGGIITKLQAQACTGRLERDIFLEPYAEWQRTAMKVAGFQPFTHFYQVTACGPAAARMSG